MDNLVTMRIGILLERALTVNYITQARFCQRIELLSLVDYYL